MIASPLPEDSMLKPYIAFLVNWHTTNRDEREDLRDGKIETSLALLHRGSYIGVPVMAESVDNVYSRLQGRDDSMVQSMSPGDLVFDLDQQQWWLCVGCGWKPIANGKIWWP